MRLLVLLGSAFATALLLSGLVLLAWLFVVGGDDEDGEPSDPIGTCAIAADFLVRSEREDELIDSIDVFCDGRVEVFTLSPATRRARFRLRPAQLAALRADLRALPRRSVAQRRGKGRLVGGRVVFRYRGKRYSVDDAAPPAELAPVTERLERLRIRGRRLNRR